MKTEMRLKHNHTHTHFPLNVCLILSSNLHPSPKFDPKYNPFPNQGWKAVLWGDTSPASPGGDARTLSAEIKAHLLLHAHTHTWWPLDLRPLKLRLNRNTPTVCPCFCCQPETKGLRTTFSLCWFISASPHEANVFMIIEYLKNKPRGL